MNESTSHVLAVARREWRAYFDSPVAYVFIIIFLMLTGFFTFSLAQFFEAGQADLNGFFHWHPWLYMILVPAVAMRLWAEEHRSGTIELLFTVSVTPMQALLGKFIAAWLFMLLALALTFPVPLTAVYLGSPDMGVAMSGYLGSGLLAGAYVAVGMLTSALTRKQVISFILAVVVGLFLILAGYSPVTSLLAHWVPTWLVDGVAAFSFMPRYEALQRGIVDLRDIVYFASMMIFMLIATQVVLKEKTGR